MDEGGHHPPLKSRPNLLDLPTGGLVVSGVACAAVSGLRNRTQFRLRLTADPHQPSLRALPGWMEEAGRQRPSQRPFLADTHVNDVPPFAAQSDNRLVLRGTAVAFEHWALDEVAAPVVGREADCGYPTPWLAAES